MEKEEIKKEVTDIINKSVEENVAKKATEMKATADEQVKSLQAEIDTLKKADAEKTSTIKNMAEEMKKNNERPLQMSRKARKEMYKEALKSELKANLAEIKEMKSTNISKAYALQQAIEKAAGTVLRANVTDGNGNAVYDQYSPIESGVLRVQLPRMVMRDLVNVGSVEGAYARWTEATAGEGVPDTVAEGNAKPQRDQDWVLKEAAVIKLAVFTKVSEETLEDIEWASEEIAADLVEQLLEVEDKYIMGVIATAAPAFDVTGTIFDAAVPTPNYMDVLRIAAAQVAAGNFDANTVVLNPADAAMMDITKNSIGGYLWVKEGDQVWYLRIVESNNMTQGNFIVGDFSRANYRIRKDVTMYAGREKDDLTKNLYTIVFELRGVSYIKDNHTPAFVAGDFASALTAIELSE